MRDAGAGFRRWVSRPEVLVQRVQEARREEEARAGAIQVEDCEGAPRSGI